MKIKGLSLKNIGYKLQPLKMKAVGSHRTPILHEKGELYFRLTVPLFGQIGAPSLEQQNLANGSAKGKNDIRTW